MNGIVIDGITKSFGGKIILDHIHARLPAGILCLSGKSGGGKTTLARIIAGLDKPDSGTVSGIIGYVTYMFQEPRLFPAFSALENVSCVSRQKEAENRAKELLLLLSLSDDDMLKKPRELSGGMNQRVSLARAILYAVCDGGNTVILDEPFKGLDPAVKEKAAALVVKELSGKNILVITHDSSDAALLGGSSVSFDALCSGGFL